MRSLRPCLRVTHSTAARRLQPLVGETLEVETPHPRAAATGVAERLDGRRLEGVEAIGKNSCFGSTAAPCCGAICGCEAAGRYASAVRRAEVAPGCAAWGREAALWGGSVLELNDRVRRLGPSVCLPDFDRMVVRVRRADQAGPSATLSSISDWSRGSETSGGRGALASTGFLRRALREMTDEELRTALGEAARMMRGSVDGDREERPGTAQQAVRVLAARRRDRVPRPGRRQPNRLLVSTLPAGPVERGLHRPGA